MTDARHGEAFALNPKAERDARYVALLNAERKPTVEVLLHLLGYREFPILLLYDALNAIFDYHERVRWHEAQVLLQEALLAAEAGEPVVDLDGPDETARHWARVASPRELEIYLRAIVRELGGAPMVNRARKSLLVDLWDALPSSDRREFLKRAGAQGFSRRSGS